MSQLTRRQLLCGATATAAFVAIGGQPVLAATPLRQFKPGGSGGFDHAAFDALVQTYVKPDAQGYNRVDYRALKARGQGELKAYVATLENARPSSMSAAEAQAYWINFYNAKTLDVVLDRYPVTSIKKINLGGGGLFGSGPWSKKLMTVEGADLSLDDIEHRIVRPLFNDPMSHYGLNCASYSCPNLVTRAYTSANIRQLLNQSAVDYVNHPRGVSVQARRIVASKIYSWYAGDFGGRRRLKTHWGQFAGPDHGAAISAASIGRFVYDWKLNDVS
ncbi:MAG: DUF547 domain-containing protein [Alphaproteobacteria bacterium]|nr:DUF547 domain-containing protein [Alphaproteobacteria bacterium]